METWETGTPFRETLREHAASQGRELDEAAAGRGLPPRALRRAARRRLRPPRGPAGRRSRTAGLLDQHLYSGKVRELYQLPAACCCSSPPTGSRPSTTCCDTLIPDKGKILTQLSLWWFERLADLVPNHLVDAPIPAEFAGRAMACKPAVDDPGGMRRPRLPGRVGAGRLPAGRAGLRDRAARPASPRAPGCRSPSSRRPRRRRAASTTRTSPLAQLAASAGRRCWRPSWSGSRWRCTGAARAWRPSGGIIVADTKIELGFDAQTARCCWPTRCSRPTRPGSGRPTSGGRAAASRRSTSSTCVTG